MIQKYLCLGELYWHWEKKHFQSACKMEEYNIHTLSQENTDVFSIQIHNEKIATEKKMNGITYPMQVDTSSDVTLTPINFP